MLCAITHSVSPFLERCELTHKALQPISVDLAARQHREYCRLLRRLSVSVIELSANQDYPDSCFVEDTAIVVDEIAIIARMGAPSRRGEVEAIHTELAKYRPTVRMKAPATLDGGDVLQSGRKLFIGQSSRTNTAGIRAISEILRPFRYQVIPVTIKNCLHLKSAATALDEITLLVNPTWLDLRPFAAFNIIEVAADEPEAANTLRIKDTVIMHDGFPGTIEVVQKAGFTVETLDISEIMKAEGALTCSSIVFRV